ncbi:MAG: bifunctional (p)ppGpp synthetase/guanosine-3',5'-bis(diphosphate) 3'-pyrophosphohydrolase [Oligoflexia bacterium]|nr:bifunctional (p)ppGpp synthetase/guanosine-3',5'-bis(diphosphate) 3'-pyrophosphohydrolase [Oligoflexia bacterium]
MSESFKDISKGEKNITPTKALAQLKDKITSYFPLADLALVDKAYKFSEKAHSGQLRRSGDPYILHPLGVATALAEMHMDLDTIITGLLHDTVEDTVATLEDIEKLFGPTIASLVDGVTKISQMSFRNTHEKQSENIRKMIIAMGRDIRVILVKLADRLHNMRTLNHMPIDRQVIISQETLDIYAPLANRLGISWLKIELEDLSLRYLKPEIYQKLSQKVSKKKNEREKYILEVISVLKKELTKESVKAEVHGRPKHFYSIYKKMEASSIDYEQVYDILAFRVLVDTMVECYEVLGVIHNIWKPIPGRFKDFIAMPKANNYQSLHTTVIGPGGERVEIQIRTHEMHLIAERGIAAHWKYKEGGGIDKETEKRFEWLHQLLQWHQQLKDPSEFLETIKTDLFAGDIYVFTPHGDVMEFPFGATALDFAYSVHTDVGNHCVATKVNGKIVPFKHKLKNGDSIEVVTSPNQKPTKDWLKMVYLSRAKNKIRAYIKSEERARAISLGTEMIEKLFKKYDLNFNNFLKPIHTEKLLKELALSELNDVIAQVGYGKIAPLKIVEILAPEKTKEPLKEPPEPDTFLRKVFKAAIQKSSKSRSAIQIHGMSDILVRFGKCCSPIPGDPIVGFITRGRGITVHLAICPKVYDMDQDRRVDVAWNLDMQTERVAKLRIVCVDEPGLLQKMSEAFAEQGVNIHTAQVRTTKDQKAISLFEVSVHDIAHLQKVMKELEKVKGVISVERMKA